MIKNNSFKIVALESTLNSIVEDEERARLMISDKAMKGFFRVNGLYNTLKDLPGMPEKIFAELVLISNKYGGSCLGGFLDGIEKIEGIIRDDKWKAKAVIMFMTNGIAMLKDPELPEATKAETIKRLPVMAGLLSKMMMVDLTKLGPQATGLRFFETFDEKSKAIKESLYLAKDWHTITWNVRQQNLWRWCRVMAEETTHPAVRVLKESLKDEALGKTLTQDLDELYNIHTLAIMLIACIDDISDNLMHEHITDWFIKIPFGTKEEIAAARAELTEDRLRYKDSLIGFFDLSCEIWEDIAARLIALKILPSPGEEDSGFGELVKTLREQYCDIMGSMTFSALMNNSPHHLDITIENAKQKLAPNMMVASFRQMEYMLVVRKYSSHISVVDNDVKVISDITNDAQSFASLSNSIATANRELRENAVCNPFFIALNEAVLKRLKTPPPTPLGSPEASLVVVVKHLDPMEKLKPNKFVQDFLAYCIENNYNNHFFETYTKEPVDFLDLIILRRRVVDKLFLDLDSLLETPKIRRALPKLHDPSKSDDPLVTARVVFDTWKDRTTELNEFSAHQLAALKKQIWHADLIDGYTQKLFKEYSVVGEAMKDCDGLLHTMKSQAHEICDETLKIHTTAYIDSWQTFVLMYLFFKQNRNGMI